jgi:hypothetical protein
VQILQDGTPVSNWAVVDISQVSNKNDRVTEDMVAQVGRTLVFSRVLKDTENLGTIIGDVTLPLPRITYTLNGTTVVPTNVRLLTTIKPRELLVLGIAKNTSLPDIVQGKLSPSFTQKFNDMLQNAIARNMVSSTANQVPKDDFSSIGGVGF